ncbi:SDR family NAD(P)-dependent oxidoreductase [Staphylococcus sp. GDY8P57P]|uniref:SDR family NAD(P)-dependent oxidoreductase n=1 Tax=Staphylococcus sp. GDY8P57P TaxID=2804128 RepID=UPI00187E500B|nr:glucose 1-dehydrogenase [Staphylococcus sp. GDY8P57P]MBF2756421.1 glucose 1-dehydrogenase [Staphylococcus haemolyticus]MBF2773668.1 glucose 1-dehydrogenase [Staphylococcus haemolyticus]MBF2775785.1 glucose 1-dehydrogenase [Staphylococcus haemolyticus]MBF2815354.1 glucose 1-dehydrogenase [Staphylococcus haemolyticus]MBF9719873.1 glucose 1-dehydrogenase [Staphylococcus haemolyticus]
MRYNEFEGKTVVITGAASGIGKATALKFAQEKANIVIGDVDERAQQTAQDINDNGGHAVFVKTDVSDPEQVRALMQKALDEFGSLDHAFNNAGILNQPKKFADLDPETFDKVMNVDVKGVFLSMKYELESMLKSGGGTIVNTASVAGLIADPQMGPYIAAKHAVVGMTKSAGFDHATDGVRINAVAPGLTETEMTKDWKDDDEKWQQMISGVPMAKAAQPDDIADIVLFLSSDSAKFMTAQVYLVDGGQTAH